jgi:hypothetical protein
MKITPTIAADRKRVFDLVLKAAIAGDRCPQNDELGTRGAATLRDLARAGRIRIEVSSLNWRQVTILEGPHRGKQTAKNPHKATRVYLVIDRAGTTVNGKLRGRPGAAQPSAPRLLSSDELQ